jgi:hypothetical protein
MALYDHREASPGKSGRAEGERRSETRSPANQSATLKILNPLQTSTRIPAQVIESSRGGLKLRLERELMPGTLVQIRVAGKLLLGEVRFCCAESGEYVIGVRLQDVFETNADSAAR